MRGKSASAPRWRACGAEGWWGVWGGLQRIAEVRLCVPPVRIPEHVRQVVVGEEHHDLREKTRVQDPK